MLLVCCSLLFLAGCSREDESADTVTQYRLKWLYNMSVVGDLYADAEGFFKEHGLKVAVKSGGPERDALKELEIGRAQFGVASADQVIRAIDKGAPLVVITQLFQVNPLQWLYRTDRFSMNSPSDLHNKIIGITFGGNDETIMRALLRKHAMELSEVELFSVRYDYAPFYLGKVDLWPVYRNAEGIVISEKLGSQNETAGFFNPDQFGIRFVANSVVTTREIASEQPELVQKFVKALLDGWQHALDPANARQAIDLVSSFDRETSREILEKQLAATRMLMQPPDGKPFGWIDIVAWQETERIMLDQKLISGPVSVEKSLVQVVID